MSEAYQSTARSRIILVLVCRDALSPEIYTNTNSLLMMSYARVSNYIIIFIITSPHARIEMCMEHIKAML